MSHSTLGLFIYFHIYIFIYFLPCAMLIKFFCVVCQETCKSQKSEKFVFKYKLKFFLSFKDWRAFIFEETHHMIKSPDDKPKYSANLIIYLKIDNKI